MKKLFLALAVSALIVGCHKDNTPSPSHAPVHSVAPQPPDTSTIFLKAAYQTPYNYSFMYWMIKDSVFKTVDSLGHRVYVSQFIAIDSLSPAIQYLQDSAIGYVFYNHCWNRLPSYPPVPGIIYPDSLYSELYQSTVDGRSYMEFNWQSKAYNSNTYVRDTMLLKVFIKPRN